MIDKAEIVKQRRDIEQFRIELQLPANSRDCTERIDAN